MIRPLYLGFTTITIATLTLSISLASIGFYSGISVAVFVGIFWAISAWRNWGGGNTMSLFFIILGVGIVALQNESMRLFLLLSAITALVAWDLTNFDILIRINQQIIARDELIRTHLLRLSSVVILGLTLPLIVFSLQFELQFWQAFLLGVILLVGLTQIFTQLKRSNQ